jgi:glycine/D-amino acid oxidase-like deaminating enzyme
MAPASIVQPIGEQQVTRTGPDEWAWRKDAPPLPQRADVVIVGGGIVGCSAAWQLARQGLQVVLFEKGRIAGEQSGRVHSVVTERGTVKTSIAACAAGAWTSAFCRSLDVSFPQLRVKGTVARTAPADHILEGQAWSPRIAIRRRRDGGYTVAHGSVLYHSIVPDTLRFARKFLPALRQEHGAIRLRLGREFFTALGSEPRDERYRVLEPAPDPRVLAEMRESLQRFFPQIAAAPFIETWAGMIETSPDVLPVISPCERMQGFFVASGFSGHGFGIGPGAGALLARMVTGGASAAALAPFRLSRFFDGSPIVPGPTI